MLIHAHCVGCFTDNAQPLLRNRRMFPRPAFSLENRESLHFCVNISFALGRNRHHSSTPYPLQSIWGVVGPIFLGMLSWKHGLQDYHTWATSPQLVCVGHGWIIYWKHRFSMGHCLHNASHFFPKALPICHGKADIYHTTPLGNHFLAP